MNKCAISNQAAFSLLNRATGSLTWGFYVMAAFLGAGLVLIASVDMRRGRVAALAAHDDHGGGSGTGEGEGEGRSIGRPADAATAGGGRDDGGRGDSAGEPAAAVGPESADKAALMASEPNIAQ